MLEPSPELIALYNKFLVWLNTSISPNTELSWGSFLIIIAVLFLILNEMGGD